MWLSILILQKCIFKSIFVDVIQRPFGVIYYRFAKEEKFWFPLTLFSQQKVSRKKTWPRISKAFIDLNWQSYFIFGMPRIESGTFSIFKKSWKFEIWKIQKILMNLKKKINYALIKKISTVDTRNNFHAHIVARLHKMMSFWSLSKHPSNVFDSHFPINILSRAERAKRAERDIYERQIDHWSYSSSKYSPHNISLSKIITTQYLT